MSTFDDIVNRRSIRKYRPECPDMDLIGKVVSAGVCAPSGKNGQSATIVAVTNPEEVKYLSRLSSKIKGKDADTFYGAPAVILVLADAESPYAVQDGSLVMGNLMNAAYSLGLGSCWINTLKEIVRLPEWKDILEKWGIKGNFIGVGFCVLGYPDEQPGMRPRKENYVYYIK